ncbi:MAG: flagellar biosynthesis protein FlhA [Planctomycetota bacterium]|nr:MAG: flagellar biosynthesis protein FlhA [Planctomycetota bacterium]
MGIIALLVVPLPPALFDVLIASSIGFSVLLLLLVLHARRPLDLSTFPTLLLFATLFRLGLNVASTRLILLGGDAGNIIAGFGNYVIGGDLLTGLVVFLILIVIQFVVITKGANRISEVSARFTLDAMPGMQMAIDADLNAGAIDEAEARRRREDLARNAEFHGAMDGASKFVRGDSIAALVITAINLIGGMVVGLRSGMALPEAARTYSVLTVGDGLVSQIPALLVSTAAAVLVTKSSTKKNLAMDMGAQFTSRPRAQRAAAAIVAGFALVPGLPALPFLALGGALWLLGRRAEGRSAEQAEQAAESEAERQASAEAQPAPVEELLAVDRLALEVGYRLIPLVEGGARGGVLGRIQALRRQFATRLGIVLPPVRVRDNLQLEPGDYAILIGGCRVAKGTLLPGHYLAMRGPHAITDIEGIDTVEPAFGLAAKWVPESARATAELAGWTVVDTTSVLITHLTEVLRRHAAELLSRDDVSALLEGVKKRAPVLVDELVPGVLSLGQVHAVLRALLREKVSIRPLEQILEALADYGPQTKDVATLTEMVRQRVARSIVADHVDAEGRLYAITLDPRLEQQLEELLAGARSQGAREGGAARLQQVAERVVETLRNAPSRGAEPVVLVRPSIRRMLSEVLQSVRANASVLSYSEVASVEHVESLGVVSLPEPPAAAA